jgi:hypothetical protein
MSKLHAPSGHKSAQPFISVPLWLAPTPLRNAKPARGILHQAVKTLAKGFVVDLFPKGQQPSGGAIFVKVKVELS